MTAGQLRWLTRAVNAVFVVGGLFACAQVALGTANGWERVAVAAVCAIALLTDAARHWKTGGTDAD